MQDPDPAFQPPIGTAVTLDPGLRRIVAPNPSPMTFRGTNTYLVGHRALAVIDPGPDDPAHLAAILDAVPAGGRISHIIVTHAHVDHSPLARRLARATGAPVLARGDALAGRSVIMQQLARDGLAGGGEGVDAAFVPDQKLDDLEWIDGDGWRLQVLYTPGHFGNHIALALGDVVLTGDLVMGWASSLVSPPDGDLTDFMTSCRRLQAGGWRRFHPGHGAPIDEPAARLDWLIDHRLSREAQILEALTEAPGHAHALAQRIYVETPSNLMGAATRNVFAHLVDLRSRGLVTCQGQLSEDALFFAAEH